MKRRAQRVRRKSSAEQCIADQSWLWDTMFHRKGRPLCGYNYMYADTDPWEILMGWPEFFDSITRWAGCGNATLTTTVSKH